MPEAYDKGDLVRCTGTFTNSAGNPVDPTTVTFKVRDPPLNEMEYVYGVDAEVVRDDQGIYHVDVSVDESGRWRYHWQSTGTGQAAGEAEFSVRRSWF